MARSLEETRKAKREHMARRRAANPDAARAYGRAYHHAKIILPFPSAALAGHDKRVNYTRAAEVKKHRAWAYTAARACKWLKPPETGDIHLLIEFEPPNNRGDRMNYSNRFKPLADGLADAWKVNDKRFVPHYVYLEPAKPGCVKVSIIDG